MIENVKNHLVFIGVTLLLCIGVLLPNFMKGDLPEWWPSRPLRLGLDLKGGAYLVLRVVTDDAVKSQLGSIAQSVKVDLKEKGAPVTRARQSGAREIEITLLNNRSLETLRELIRKDFPDLREVEVTGDTRIVARYQISDKRAEEIKQEAVLQAIEVIRSRVDSYGVTEPTIQRVGDDLINVQLPDVQNLDEVKRTIGKVAKLEFRVVAKPDADSASGDVRSFRQKEGGSLMLEEAVLMTGDAIKTARVDIGQTMASEVSLQFTPQGSKTFADVTSENVGRKLAIVLDGVVQSSPNIREPITQGQAQISGSFSQQEAHQLAVVLRSGALPAELKVDSERTVGASLGEDAIRSGLLALLVGSLAVIIFVLFYYKKSGLLAVCCLFANILFLMTLLSSLGATLTLPGMAGLILVIAMALDANVIIFERIKEEIRNGSSTTAAIQAGFAHAHWTVMDSNITTFMTGIFLFMFGTGPIKGFAVTMCLGIVTSLFAALYVARVLFQVLPVKDSKGVLSI